MRWRRWKGLIVRKNSFTYDSVYQPNITDEYAKGAATQKKSKTEITHNTEEADEKKRH